MSYLDIPNLYFSGRFFANPSTINNKLANYNPDVKLIPIDKVPFGVQSHWSDYTGFPYVNPTGEGLFYFTDCFVRGGMDATGKEVTGTTHPAVWGAKVETLMPPARMVDMDPDQQSITQIYGLQIKVTFRDNTGFYGPLEVPSLTDLWYGRVPSCPGDSGASGFFQSVIPIDKIAWQGLERSAFLRVFKAAAVKGISVKWMLDAYQGQKDHPDFNRGRVVGVIGPALELEPVRFPAARRLKSNQSKFGNAFFKVDTTNEMIIFDLSNCIPLESPAGASLSYGLMQPVILKEPGPQFIPGFIDYSKINLENNAGICRLPVPRNILHLLDKYPLGISVNKPFEGGPHIVMKEDDSLKWVNFDQSWLRLSPNQVAEVPFFARKGNHPAAMEEIYFYITESQVNNKPHSGVTFETVVTCDEHGQGRLKITAGSPSPLPPRRAVIDSQLYYIGGPWQQLGGFQAQSGGGALTILLFNHFSCPPYVNWEDHIEPVFSMYSRLYPGILNKEYNFSDLAEVRKHAVSIRERLLLPLEDVRYLLVNRDLAPEKVNMIIKWIDNGLPATLQEAIALYKRQAALDTPIETANLLIRRYDVKDASELFSGITANKKHLEGVLHPRVASLASVKETKKLIQSLETDWKNRQQMIVPVWLNDSQTLAGELYVGNFNWKCNEAEIGYFLFAEYEGQGIAYEAVTALIKVLFSEMQLSAITCRCDADNNRSVKLAERVGFRATSRNGTSRTRPDGSKIPVLTFRLIADQF